MCSEGFDQSLLIKILTVIECALVVAVNTRTGVERFEFVSNSIVYAAGGFIIVVGIFLGWSIIKEDVDKIFAAWMMTCGAIWSIGAGVGLIIYYIDYKNSTGDMQLVGGCLVLAGGVVMLVDALHNFGLF